jgi:hypothetical protein
MSDEQKSAKERYIRVAAIDIVSREGTRNICLTERCEKPASSCNNSKRTHDIQRV